jgi:hypothetical protein
MCVFSQCSEIEITSLIRTVCMTLKFHILLIPLTSNKEIAFFKIILQRTHYKGTALSQFLVMFHITAFKSSENTAFQLYT